MPQLSPEWFAIKLGKGSASHMPEILTTGTGRQTYIDRVAAEVITGKNHKGYSDKNLERGILLEPEARVKYEMIKNVEVGQVGWVEMDNGRVGCSPDGEPPGGLLEIKCVIPTTQIRYCRMWAKNPTWVPPEYKPQMTTQMWICGKPWVDFMSYSPLIKEEFKDIKIVRFFKDAKAILTMKDAVELFIEDLDKEIGNMRLAA